VPTRLTVIISQSASRDSRAADAEETLLAELMMASGLDATLIGPLEHIAPESTDFLCLNSFNHSLALVSWLSAEQVASECQRLQLASQVVALGQLVSPEGAAKRVYYFSMRQPTSTILSQLLELKHDRSVQTVGIMLPGAGVTPSKTPPPKAPSAPVVVAPNVPSTNGKKADASPDAADVDDWANLDQLVDDFDALDL
jgi:hypothetical protein